MAWTYGGAPTPGTRDEIRFLIGDTVSADQLLLDAEIDYAMGLEPTAYLAAAICCESIAGLYGRLADSVVDSVQQRMSQKSAQYRTRAVQLRRLAAIGCTPTFGGISWAVKDALNSNTDEVHPVFQKGDDDIPGGVGLGPVLNTDPFFEGF
jgi:hypothetical protein